MPCFQLQCWWSSHWSHPGMLNCFKFAPSSAKCSEPIIRETFLSMIFFWALPLWVEFFTLWSGTSFCGPKVSTLKFQSYVSFSYIFGVQFVDKHIGHTAHWRPEVRLNDVTFSDRLCKGQGHDKAFIHSVLSMGHRFKLHFLSPFIFFMTSLFVHHELPKHH